jgi:hypothetical protein
VVILLIPLFTRAPFRREQEFAGFSLVVAGSIIAYMYSRFSCYEQLRPRLLKKHALFMHMVYYSPCDPLCTCVRATIHSRGLMVRYNILQQVDSRAGPTGYSLCTQSVEVLQGY